MSAPSAASIQPHRVRLDRFLAAANQQMTMQSLMSFYRSDVACAKVAREACLPLVADRADDLRESQGRLRDVMDLWNEERPPDNGADPALRDGLVAVTVADRAPARTVEWLLFDAARLLNTTSHALQCPRR